MGIGMSLALLLTSALSGGPAGPCVAQQGGELAGERVEAIMHDATIGRYWLRVRDCAHPEWPARWLPAPSGSEPALEGTATLMSLYPVLAPGRKLEKSVETLPVRAGMQVLLWQDGSARIRLSGVATQSAKLGGSVVVRCGPDRLLRGIVRGPGSVELAITPTWGQP